MRQKELSIWLRAVVVIGWIACALLAWLIAPRLAQDAVDTAPDFARLAWPCLMLFWLGLAVVAIALWFGWKIFAEIGRNNSFCRENARRLRTISWLALGDSLLCILGIAVLLCLQSLHPGVFLLLLLLTVIGVGITVAAAALSHLTLKAALLQDENDLTI